ncbi:unnamed protein product [Ilex paraguariensis]|uniref:Uncharacterized protein n=1 Tax=Ilex paraguariensis TaxID=185542 RepID=A0ABC8SKK7_9AQUA
MASLVPENWSCMNGPNHDFHNMEVSEVETALLISLLDESQGDDICDDERLRSVIQSLEVEIGPQMVDDVHNSFVDPSYYTNMALEEGCSLSEGGVHADGQDCSSSCDLDHTYWMDMEMMLSSPSDCMINWYLDSYGEDMEGMGIFEFGVRDCFSFSYYGNCIEDHEYGSLWQDTNDSEMDS